MAIEFDRELLKLDQLVGEELSQPLIEGEINVPDDKPDIARILDVSGTAYITGKEVIQDKVMVEGIIRYNLLYVAEGENRSITSVETEESFTHYIEVAGTKPRMMARTDIDIEHIDFEVVNRRKINVKTVLNLNCRVIQSLQLEAVRDFKEKADVQTLKEKVRMTVSGGEGTSQTILRDDFEIADDMPSIVDVLKKSARARITETKTADNKVIAHGEIDVQILYYSGEEEDPVQALEQNIPFSHFVEIPGAYQGMESVADVSIQEFNVSIRPDINQENRILAVEMMISIDARVFEVDDHEVIIDAYSPARVLDLKKKPIYMQRIVGEHQAQATIRESMSFPNNIPTASKILYVEAKPVMTDYSINEEQVTIEGILPISILYQSEDQGIWVGSFKTEIPFSYDMNIAGIKDNMDCECKLGVVHIAHTLLAPDEVEVKVTVSAKVAVTETFEKEILLGAEEIEGAVDKKSGIFIYFVQPGDTLWSVAKKYNATIDSLLKYNELENQDTLEPGSRLVIYKKLDSSIA